MFQTSTTDSGCNDGGDSLHAGLLSTANSSGGTGKRRGFRHIGICVRLLISISKRPFDHHHGVSSPLSSSAVPPPPIDKQFSRTSSSSSQFVIVPPPIDKQFSRTSSSSSQFVIDIRINSEIEEEEEEEEDSPDEPEEDEQEQLRRIVQEKDLDSLQRFGGVERVASVLGSNLATGIVPRHGPGVLRWKTEGFLHFFLEACNSYTILLLLLSAGLSFGNQMIDKGPKYGWHEGATILFAIFLLVTFPSVANFRHARKLEKKLLGYSPVGNSLEKKLLEKKLLKEEEKLDVNVVRGGRPLRVTITHIAAGDIVLLYEGDMVPADGLLVNGDGLEVDEVLDSKINCDQNPFLFSGSMVIGGHGRMLVTSVGTKTKLGKVLSLVSRDPEGMTLLEAKIHKPINYTDKIALGITVVISLVLLLRLLGRRHHVDNGFPELKGDVSLGYLMKLFERIFLRPRGMIGVLTTSLIAMVIGLQHGMPFVITISLSYWKKKMVSNHANPQNLSACGTMGLVDVLCTDTTGGLMCNQLEVNNFWIGEEDVKDDENLETSQFFLDTLGLGIGVAVLVSQIPVGPADNSLISWVKSRWGVNMEFPEESYAIHDYKNVCSNKKCSGVLLRKNGDDEKILHLHWKGAASTILGMCSHYYDCRGRTCAMENQKCKFEQVIKDMEDSGLRPIAYAYKQTEIPELGEDGLNLLAIVGFKYACQEVKSALEALGETGMRIKLVSGDELSTVRAIAYGFGILSSGSNDVVLEGREFRRLNSTDRKEIVGKITVMGSSQPEDKLLMVQCLKQVGHIVAFHGGTTTSDTPALKEADIGITEEARSTEMARESCDFVISDISSLTRNFESGRCVCHNIQKFVQLQLTAIISGLLITFITTVFLGESPITAIQLIWINLITWILGGAMLVMEPPNQEQMINQPAGRRSESLVTKSMWRDINTQVLYQAVVLLVFQFKGQAIPSMIPKVRKALIFNSFTLCQVFNQFNAMDLVKKEVLSKVVLQKYYCFLVAVGAIAVMQFLVVEFAGSLANGMRLNWVQWAFCAIIAALSCGFDRAVKSISNSSRSVGSCIRFSRWMPSSCASLWLFPCSMFLLFSLSYYFNPGTALSFR